MTQIQAVAVPGIPMIASGDDIAAVISPYLNRLKWPDLHVGLRGDDVVVIAGKIVAKAQGLWQRADEREAGFRTRAGIPEGLGLRAPAQAAVEAATIRRGLTARFGGRPGVLVTGSAVSDTADGVAGGGSGRGDDSLRGGGSGRGVVDVALGSAGLDQQTETGLSVVDAIAAQAGLLMELSGCPVVVIRDLPGIMTWED